MNWKLEFEYDDADLLSAARPSGFRRWIDGIVLGLMALTAVSLPLYILLGGELGLTTGKFLQRYGPFYVVLAIVAFGWIARRRAILRNKNLRGPIEIDISESGVAISTSASKSEMGWSVFTKVSETDRVFRLHAGRGLYYIIPKHAFVPSEEADRFREWVRSRVPPR